MKTATSTRAAAAAQARPWLGLQTLCCALLLALAVCGLLILRSQVTVFDFGDSGPDARFFPRLILGLLALACALRLWFGRRREQPELGPASGWGRVLLVAVLLAAAVAAMGSFGFLACAALAAVLLAWLLGERHLGYALLLPLAVAVLVSLGARYALNIPLP